MDRRLLIYGSVFVACVAIAGFFIGIMTASSFKMPEVLKAEETLIGENIAGTPGSFSQIVENASPAVISIEGKRTIVYESPWNDFFDDPFFRRFFGEVPRRKLRRDQKWLGSGFIVEYKDNDYILTNNHVVDKAEELTIILSNEKEFSGDDIELIGSDPATDLAVIRLKTDGNLPDIKPGSVEGLKVGDWVIAIGNPFGLYGTVTAGVVSAKGRSGIPLHQNIYENFIQTDAAINPGNSGGPLLNTEGRVVGVNTLILSRTGGNIGLGFAIPIDMAMDILKTLVSKGKISRGYLGVYLEDLSEEIKESLNYKYNYGVYILSIEKDSPAAKAGLSDGDIILSLSDKKASNMNQLRLLVASMEPGEKVRVKIWRNGKEKEYTVTLGKRPEIKSAETTEQEIEWLGMRLLSTGSSKSKRYWEEDYNGVFIYDIEPDSPSDRAGIPVNSIIVGVQQSNRSIEINNLDDIIKAKEEFDTPLILRVKLRNGLIKVYAIKE